MRQLDRLLKHASYCNRLEQRRSTGQFAWIWIVATLLTCNRLLSQRPPLGHLIRRHGTGLAAELRDDIVSQSRYFRVRIGRGE